MPGFNSNSKRVGNSSLQYTFYDQFLPNQFTSNEWLKNSELYSLHSEF